MSDMQQGMVVLSVTLVIAVTCISFAIHIAIRNKRRFRCPQCGSGKMKPGTIVKADGIRGGVFTPMSYQKYTCNECHAQLVTDIGSETLTLVEHPSTSQSPTQPTDMTDGHDSASSRV